MARVNRPFWQNMQAAEENGELWVIRAKGDRIGTFSM